DWQMERLTGVAVRYMRVGAERLNWCFCAVNSNGIPSAFCPKREGGFPVLYYALVFLIVGLVAGVLGATGVAVIASKIAWVLFIVGIILLVVHLATGRRGPVI